MPSPYNTMEDRPGDQSGNAKKLATSTGQDGWGEDDSSNTTQSAMGTKKALWAYLVLCFSTGPTSSMAFNYVSAAIQSAANYVGHEPGSDKPCARRGTNISCVVNFGTGEVDYQSYMLISC
ncbi:uncharacterized protein TRUGW13939_02576 [Talaromyces rugulosus]|uniref:Autophagy-related protein n=1 Tax=Talaromyces rugulosus TaxID=121627 RepID=A0A7H8QQQ7_TALRU|nr:uncharacterized protein TRUGW13939_02576 [Talaromyces rugulosus]QKX55483.1 hypothetical protein TRUGW13939_02576 [Talaromyces rugulosus]